VKTKSVPPLITNTQYIKREISYMKMLYTEEYLKSLSHTELCNLMEEHGYEEGYEELDSNGLIEQLSNVVC